MIAITQGIGPASRPSGSRPRSAAPNLRTPPFTARPAAADGAARRSDRRSGRGRAAASRRAGTSVEQMEIVGGDDDRRAELVERVEQIEQPLAPCPDRRCRSARRRPAIRAGRSPRGRWRRAAARRPRGSAGRALARSARPTQASISRTGVSRSLSSTPATRSGSATLSKVERCGTRRKSWKTTPIRRRKPGSRVARHGDDVLAEQPDQARGSGAARDRAA